jgi:hypothetical protein
MMRFMKADDGTAFNVDQIVAVGPANVMRKSKGFGPYLMVELSDGRTAVPLYRDTKAVWPGDALDEFLRAVSGEPRMDVESGDAAVKRSANMAGM